MPRIRTIKPEFWRSEDVVRLPRELRLLFVGLWTYVDDNGVGVDDHRLVTAELFPLEDDQAEAREFVREGLATLSRQSLVIRYQVSDKFYLFVRTWDRHQKIDKPNKPRYPRPTTEATTVTSDNSEIATPSRHSREGVATGTEEQRNRGTDHSPSGSDARTRAPARTREAPPASATTSPATVHGSISAADVVAAWVDSTNANGVSPTSRSKGMVAKEAKSLLESGNDPDRVLRAAVDAGIKGFPNLERELMAMSGRAIPKRIANKPTRDDKVRALLELAQREENRNG